MSKRRLVGRACPPRSALVDGRADLAGRWLAFSVALLCIALWLGPIQAITSAEDVAVRPLSSAMSLHGPANSAAPSVAPTRVAEPAVPAADGDSARTFDASLVPGDRSVTQNLFVVVPELPTSTTTVPASSTTTATPTSSPAVPPSTPVQRPEPGSRPHAPLPGAGTSSSGASSPLPATGAGGQLLRMVVLGILLIDAGLLALHASRRRSVRHPRGAV